MLPLLLLTNLLFNGSLEDLNGDGRPDGWEAAFPEVRMVVGVKGEAVECQLDTGRYWRLLRSRPFPVRVGQKFVVSIWLKGRRSRECMSSFISSMPRGGGFTLTASSPRPSPSRGGLSRRAGVRSTGRSPEWLLGLGAVGGDFRGRGREGQIRQAQSVGREEGREVLGGRGEGGGV